MKKAVLFFALTLTTATITNAQATANTISRSSSIDGTYQIQVVNSRMKPLIPTDLPQLVTANRDATQVKYVKLGTDTRLKILPLSEINSPNFKPLEKVAYVSE